MSVQIILKNSSVEDKRPTANQLTNGEISLNYNAAGAFLCCRDDAGNIQQVGGIKISDAAPGSPVRGTLWYQPTNSTLFVHNGTNWLSVAGGGNGGNGGGDVSQIIGADGIDVAPAAGTGVVTLNADIDTDRGLEFVAGEIAVNLGTGLSFNSTTGAIDADNQALTYKGTVDLTTDGDVPGIKALGDTYANTGSGNFASDWVTATGEAAGTDADPGDLVAWNGAVWTFIPTGSPGGNGITNLTYIPTAGGTASQGGTVESSTGTSADIPMVGNVAAGVINGAAQAGLMYPEDKVLIDSLPTDGNGNFEQAQSDWNEDDVNDPAHILNRPTITTDANGDITNVNVDLGYTAAVDEGTVTNNRGTDATIPFATNANAGLFIEAGTPAAGTAQYVRQVTDAGEATWEEAPEGFWERDADNELLSPINVDDNVDIGGELGVGGDIITDRDLVIATPGQGLFITGSEDADTAHMVQINAPNENPDFTDNYALTLPPNDGDAGQFLQTDGAGVLTWGVGGAAVTVSDTAPADPAQGDLWYNTDDGRTYVRYVESITDAAATLNVSTAGTGYVARNGVALTGGTGEGCIVNITAVGAGGALTNAGVTLVTGGSGYAVNDVLTVPGGDGAGRITVQTIGPSTDAQWVDAAPNGAIDNNWTRTGTTLSPTNAGDNVEIGDITLNADGTAGFCQAGADIQIVDTYSHPIWGGLAANRKGLELGGLDGQIGFHDLTETVQAGTDIQIFSEGGVLRIYQITSLRANKTNIQPLPSVWDKIKALKPCSFNGITEHDKDKNSYGFIAEEVNEVDSHFAVRDEEGLKGIAYNAVTAALTAALQESITRIEALEAEVQSLKGGN